MPIRERDPWRLQYFAGIECPANVFIPTDDVDAYRWNEPYRWVYNKLRVAESQRLECAPHGIEPRHYPVFSKPIYNLEGMGVGSRALLTREDYVAHCRPGHMWMLLLEGEHVSSDLAIINGRVRWVRHTIGLAASGGTFDYWTVEDRRRPSLEEYLARWVESYMGGYTGMLNIESIGGTIIEVHLRFADQWPDLYGAGWLDAMVRVYAEGVWDYPDTDRRPGFSVILFGPHEREYSHPPVALADDVLTYAGVSSLQITFHESRPAGAHIMPPGGFRLAIVNTWDLAAGFRAREELARGFGVATPFRR